MKNTFVKVLSMMIALMMVVGMFTSLPVFAAGCTHEGTTLEKVEPPTCEDNGYTRYECTACEEKWVDNIIPASPEFHDWAEVKAEPATCTQGSHSAGKICNTCGEKTYVENNDKLAHVFIKTKTELTCTQDEAYVFVCKLCKDSAEKIYGDDVPAELAKEVITPAQGCDPNNYDWEIVSMPTNGATCVNGLAVGTCAFCGDTEKKVLPVQHIWKPVVENVGQACSLYKSGEICKFCSEPRPENPPVANVGGDHSFDYTNSANIVGLNATLTASGVADWTFAMFEEIDIFVNDRLSYAPTCTTPGQYIGVCACGAPVKISVPATGHTYSAFTSGVRYGVPGADGKYTEAGLYATKTLCVQDGVQTQTCVNGTCDAKNYRVVEEGAADHTWENDEIKPTCYANGYTTTDCSVEGCAFVAYNHTYTDKLTHTYDAPYAQKVTSGGDYCGGKVNWMKGCNLCKNEDGSYSHTTKAAATELTDAQKDHKYTKQTFPATCTAPAYTEEICDWCGSAKADTKKNVEGSTPNTSAHDFTEYKKNGDTFYTEGFNNINWAGDNTKSTCYAYGQSVWTCKRCGELKVAASATYAAHTPVASFNGTAANGTKVNVSAVAPTCQADGKTAGTACSGCGLITVAQEKIEKNINDPAQHTNAKEVASAGATCTTRAYKKYTTTCGCGVITIYTGDLAEHNYYSVADDPATPDINEAQYNYVGFHAPSCEATGNHRYVKCVNCNNVLPGSVDGVGCTLVNGVCPYGFDHALLGLYNNTNYTISAIGAHNWAANDEAGHYDRVEEKCDEDGTYEKTTCKVCGKIKVMTDEGDKIFAASETAKIAKAEKIPQHGAYYKRYVAPVDATCTQEGVLANEATGNMWCTKCMNKFDDPATDDVVEGYRVNKDPHNYTNRVNINWTGTNVKNCMEPYGWVDTCSECGDVLAYTHAELNDKDDHAWENKAASTVVGPTCTSGGYRLYKCTLCPATKKEEKVGPAKHYEEKDGVKTEFDLSCTEISKYDGKYCFACGYIVDASGEKVDDASKDLHYLHAEHNRVPKSQTATCTKDGFNIVYCADCGTTLENDSYVPAYGHDYYDLDAMNKVEYVIEETDTYVDFVCGFCGEAQRTLKPVAETDDVEIVLGKYNTLEIAGDKYTNSSKVAITVALKAEQAIGASVINLNIQYSNNLKYDGFTFDKDTAFTAFQDAADNNDDTYDKKGNFVEGAADFVSITAATEFDKGQAPVDFVIDGEIQLVTLYFIIVNEDIAETDAFVKVTKADLYNTKDEKLDVTLANYAEFVIKVEKFMDANGNGDFTAADLRVAAELFAEDAYNVAADVDKDGEITYTDLIAIQDYINGVRTYDEIAALGSEA